MVKGKITMDIGIGPTVEIEINPTIEVEERGNLYQNRGYRPNYRVRSGSRNYRYGNGYRGNKFPKL